MSRGAVPSVLTGEQHGFAVLECLGPRLRAGTVLVFDEYFGNERWRQDEHRAYVEAAERFGWKRDWLATSWITGQAAFRIGE